MRCRCTGCREPLASENASFVNGDEFCATCYESNADGGNPGDDNGGDDAGTVDPEKDEHMAAISDEVDLDSDEEVGKKKRKVQFVLC